MEDRLFTVKDRSICSTGTGQDGPSSLKDQGGPSSPKDQCGPSNPNNEGVACASDDDTPNKSSEMLTGTSAIVKRRYRPAYTKATFNGSYFRHAEGEPEVVQLSEKFKVYVSKEGLSTIKRNCKSGTDTARNLLMEVFSEEAVEQCSVTGRPAAGRGKELATLRPPLDGNGVAAIHAFAVARAKKKGWKIPEVKDTNKALADKLGETRYYRRLEEKARNVATTA